MKVYNEEIDIMFCEFVFFKEEYFCKKKMMGVDIVFVNY